MTDSATGNQRFPASGPTLKRVITLPMLIFYGVGVTIGAGIFALSGEVIGISGNHAPLAFLLAALIAGLTAVSYSLLASDSSKAAGEAWFVRQAFGARASIAVGLLLVVSAIFSSAAIAISFANYLTQVISLPESFLILLAISIITLIAIKGIRETVVFAAIITLIEVGALVTVIAVGIPQVLDAPDLAYKILPSSDLTALPMIFSGAVVAFFAFIGFEDIVNMGEETVSAKSNLPIAIMATLCITLVIYLLVSIVCVAMPDRVSFLASGAPLAYVFEASTGRDPRLISVCAAIAMVNGILVQIVMSSRVLYGLARAGSLPRTLSRVNQHTQTPIMAITLVASLVGALSLSFSLMHLAVYSSVVLLIVFCAVNLSLWRRGFKNPESKFKRWSNWGLFSFIACFTLLSWQIIETISALLN